MVAMLLGGVLVTGCTTAYDDGRGDDISLLDPVSVAAPYATVARRDIYVSEVISAICCPEVTEIPFESDIHFRSYLKMPGEKVSVGDALISGDTSYFDNQIENLVESIADMEEQYSDSVEQLSDALSKAKRDYEDKAAIVERLEESRPEEDSEDYEGWQKEYNNWDGQSRYAYIAYQRAELALKERQELYKLDHDYQLFKLSDVRRQKGEMQLLAPEDGTVVSFKYYNYDDYIGKNSLGMAVSAMDTKVLKCAYVNAGVINKAEDVYAIVNGVRYEVSYRPMDSDEYKRLSEKNGTVYSTFDIADPDGKIGFGDYAVIVIIKDSRKGALCVPSSSVAFDGDGYIAYAFEGEGFKEKSVITGLNDGLYTEILSGLSEGDLVKAEYKLGGGSNEAEVLKGSIGYDFSSTGYLFYPTSMNIMNPVKYGTTYLDEICVVTNEQVEKGQVIARVHVVADQIETDRTARSLQRLNESLDELLKTDENDSNKYSIKAVRKQIDETQKILNEMRNDAAVKEIVAQTGGIITSIIRNAKPGDLIPNDSAIGMIADDASCFILVEDEQGRLSLGNTVTVTYTDKAGVNKDAEGSVVSVNPIAVSRELQQEYSLVQLPPEVMGDIAGSNADAGWWRATRVSVNATVRSMEGVLLIPKKAVKEVKGTTFVKVIDDNGSISEVSFVAGGSDNNYYWVAEGLSEGTKICWE